MDDVAADEHVSRDGASCDTPVTGRLPALRRALVQWVMDDMPGEHADVPFAVQLSGFREFEPLAGVERWSVAEVLNALVGDDAPLPHELVSTFDVPSDATFGCLAARAHEARRHRPHGRPGEILRSLVRGVHVIQDVRVGRPIDPDDLGGPSATAVARGV